MRGRGRREGWDKWRGSFLRIGRDLQKYNGQRKLLRHKKDAQGKRRSRTLGALVFSTEGMLRGN